MSRSDLEAAYAPVDADVEPEDAYNISYISFLMLGFSLLVPWNAIISSLDFWNQTFPGHTMGTVYSVAFQSPSLIGLALVTLYGSRFSFRARIVPLFAVMAVALGLMPFLTSFDVTIVLAVIIGFVGTMASGSVFGMAAMFAPRHISAVMTGQGVAGLLVAMLRMLFKVCFSNGLALVSNLLVFFSQLNFVSCSTDKAGTDTATYVYFGIAVLVIVMGIALFIFALEPSPVTAFYLKRAENAASDHARVNSTEDESGHAVVVPSPMRSDASQYQALHDPASPDELNQELSMWSTVRHMSIAVFGVFWVTLALFPGITSQIQSTHPSVRFDSDLSIQAFVCFACSTLLDCASDE
jgi:equilibrative nucleoside transporter 1/2/3